MGRTMGRVMGESHGGEIPAKARFGGSPSREPAFDDPPCFAILCRAAVMPALAHGGIRTGPHMLAAADIAPRKRIALVAHDNKKQDLLEWAIYNREMLARHELCATGTTGKLLEDALKMPIEKLQSGPLGGDLQIGAKIAEGRIDFVIFFWDPLEAQPHDPDVKALIRIAVVWNIPVACNRASADFMISSPLMSSTYRRRLPDHQAHLARFQRPSGE